MINSDKYTFLIYHLMVSEDKSGHTKPLHQAKSPPHMSRISKRIVHTRIIESYGKYSR